MPYTWIEISKSALLHNLAQYKKYIGTHNILAPVVKANAYGHGMLQVAHICQESPDADWLCVALLSDALLLREHGITKPIFVLGYIDVDPALAAHKHIDLLVYDLAIAQQLNTIGNKHNCVFNIHIKIDTGLSRLGVLPHEAHTFIATIRTLPGIALRGIYSHLAESQLEDTTFTHQQLQKFDTLLMQLDLPFALKHVANTAATMRFSRNNYNFFRVGAGTYGLWPSETVKNITLQQDPSFTLKPVLTWKTRIMHIKKVHADTSVGYNRTHQTTKESTLAIVPIGYYDGYDIRYGNKGMVKIGNAYAPIVGRVCMNHTIIDVSNIPPVQIGDEVTLMGADEPISAPRFAQLTGNNNVREVLTNIYPHIERRIVP